MRRQGQILIPGTAKGLALRLDAPISFWGGVCPKTAKIVLEGHPQRGATIDGTLLLIPQLSGSSSSSAVLLELIHNGKAPKALILGACDAILPIGVVAARQMGWGSLPVMHLAHAPFQTGDHLSIDDDGHINRL